MLLGRLGGEERWWCPRVAQPASFGMSDQSSRALFSRCRRGGGGVVLQHRLKQIFFVGEVARRRLETLSMI